MAESVLVALSGGIDSTMTAYMLLEQGYDVKEVHFQFFDDPREKAVTVADQPGI